jgi:hypothetical protein
MATYYLILSDFEDWPKIYRIPDEHVSAVMAVSGIIMNSADEVSWKSYNDFHDAVGLFLNSDHLVNLEDMTFNDARFIQVGLEP